MSSIEWLMAYDLHRMLLNLSRFDSMTLGVERYLFVELAVAPIPFPLALAKSLVYPDQLSDDHSLSSRLSSLGLSAVLAPTKTQIQHTKI